MNLLFSANIVKGQEYETGTLPATVLVIATLDGDNSDNWHKLGLMQHIMASLEFPEPHRFAGFTRGLFKGNYILELPNYGFQGSYSSTLKLMPASWLEQGTVKIYG